jgi:hypothetical protein
MTLPRRADEFLVFASHVYLELVLRSGGDVIACLISFTAD